MYIKKQKYKILQLLLKEMITINNNTKYKISINADKCSRCGTCVDVCNEEIFKIEDNQIKIMQDKECKACGHCIAACRYGAIQHNLLPLNKCPQFSEQNQPKLEEMVTLFKSRRSIKNFSSKPVDKSLIEKLIEISRWVPSSQNKQSVDWLILNKNTEIKYFSKRTVEVLFGLSKILHNPVYKPFINIVLGKKKYKETMHSAVSFSDLNKRYRNGEDPIFYNAPVVLIGYTPSNVYFGRDDSIYASYNIMLAAHKLGLGSRQIGYFIVALNNNTGLRKQLKLPAGCIPQVAIILGYPKYSFYCGVPKRTPEIKWGIK